MKIPSQLFTQYQQYKNYTALVVEWIVNTLNECDTNNNTQKQNEKQKTGGQKHKTKKKKGKTKRAPQINNSSKLQEKPSISEIYSMIGKIAEKGIQTPEWVLPFSFKKSFQIEVTAPNFI